MNKPKIKSTLLRCLEDAGKVLKTSLLLKKSIEKKTELSLVTQIDKKCEKIIIGHILKAFPDHALLTEESDPIGKSTSRWIIDPLDGTTNFAHSFPVACVSIAYEENGVLEAGGVYDPFRDELFLGFRGQGATLNGKKIKPSTVSKLNDALVCTGFPYDRLERPDEYLAVFKAVLLKVTDLRRTGSAALDLCYVASGRFDGYWEFNLQPWDKAAAMVILREAGGKMTDFSGTSLNLAHIQNVASNGKIHSQMLEAFKPFRSFLKI
jgi:myo-inositol-1(or 4)-monophosphatase